LSTVFDERTGFWQEFPFVGVGDSSVGKAVGRESMYLQFDAGSRDYGLFVHFAESVTGVKA